MKRKNNKLKSAVATIAIILLVLLVAGLALQIFMPAGKKVSDWFASFKQSDETQQSMLKVGDEVTELQGNFDKSIDEVVAMLDSLDWSIPDTTVPGAYKTLSLCTFDTVTDLNGSECTPCLYALKYSSPDNGKPYEIIFDNGTRYHGSVGYFLWTQSAGWNSVVYDHIKTLTVKEVFQQDIWQDFIFNTTVAKTDNVNRSQIAVNDKITRFYGNANKTTEEIVAMLDSLDWSEATTFGGSLSKTLPLCNLSSVTEYKQKLYVEKVLNSSYGNVEQPYRIVMTLDGYVTQGKTSYILWSQTTGWNTEPFTFDPAIYVESVQQQDIWKDFISKEPF